MNSPGKTFFVGNLSEKISEDNLLLWIPKVEKMSSVLKWNVKNINRIRNENQWLKWKQCRLKKKIKYLNNFVNS